MSQLSNLAVCDVEVKINDGMLEIRVHHDQTYVPVARSPHRGACWRMEVKSCPPQHHVELENTESFRGFAKYW